MVLAAALAPAGDALAQTPFEILPGSTFSYFVGGLDQVPDCDGNDDRICDFGLSGTFRFDGDAITDADLTLTSLVSVDPVLPNQITTAERLENFLEGLEWIPIPSIPPIAASSATNLPPNGSLIHSYAVPPLGDGTGTLSGGYDLRPVDGDGVQLNALIRVIPEPSAWLLGALACVTGLPRRR